MVAPQAPEFVNFLNEAAGSPFTATGIVFLCVFFVLKLFVTFFVFVKQIAAICKRLVDAGFTKLNENEPWKLTTGGK